VLLLKVTKAAAIDGGCGTRASSYDYDEWQLAGKKKPNPSNDNWDPRTRMQNSTSQYHSSELQDSSYKLLETCSHQD